MTKTLATIIIFSFALSGAALGATYVLDGKGNCHDEHGKFAKLELCPHHIYKLDVKGKCHDEHGRFAKMSFCHA